MKISFFIFSLLLIPFPSLSASLDIFKDYHSLVMNYLNQDPKHHHNFFNKTLPSDYLPYQQYTKTTLDRLNNLTLDDYIKSTYNERLAFWINTYNLCTLNTILDHYSEIHSKKILKGHFIKSLFDIPSIKVFNKTRSLNQIKKEIFEEEFDDPRVIFALYMGSKDGPNLYFYPFESPSLDIELNKVTSRYLEDHTFINTPHHFIALPDYISWWAKEWEPKNISSKYTEDLQFTNKHFQEKLILILLKNYYLYSYHRHQLLQILLDPKLKIRFTRFDWSLKE